MQKKVESLGIFELKILLGLNWAGFARCEDLQGFLEKYTGKIPSLGALHTTLSRMSKKRLVTSTLRKSKLGRPFRRYEITALGDRSVNKEVSQILVMGGKAKNKSNNEEWVGKHHKDCILIGHADHELYETPCVVRSALNLE